MRNQYSEKTGGDTIETTLGGDSAADSKLGVKDDEVLLYHQEQDFYNNYYHNHLHRVNKSKRLQP